MPEVKSQILSLLQLMHTLAGIRGKAHMLESLPLTVEAQAGFPNPDIDLAERKLLASFQE